MCSHTKLDFIGGWCGLRNEEFVIYEIKGHKWAGNVAYMREFKEHAKCCRKT